MLTYSEDNLFLIGRLKDLLKLPMNFDETRQSEVEILEYLKQEAKRKD